MAVLEIRQRTGWLFVGRGCGPPRPDLDAGEDARGAAVLQLLGVRRLRRRSSAATTRRQRRQATVAGLLRAAADPPRERGADSSEVGAAAHRPAARDRRGGAGRARCRIAARAAARAAVRRRRSPGHRWSGQPGVPDDDIDKGTDDGLRTDMAVIAPSGRGRPHHPAERAGRRRCSCSSTPMRRPARSSNARAPRASWWATEESRFRLEYVPSSADIKVGDRVVTSGIEGSFRLPRTALVRRRASIDGEYPRGFVIGHIESLETRRRSVRERGRASGRRVHLARIGAGRAERRRGRRDRRGDRRHGAATGAERGAVKAIGAVVAIARGAGAADDARSLHRRIDGGGGSRARRGRVRRADQRSGRRHVRGQSWRG